MSPLRPLVTIKIYLLLWTGAFLFAAIIPFTHRSGSWANAAALTAVYVILSTTVAFAAQHVASGLCRGHVQTGVIAGRGGWGSIAPLLALLGVVGVMLILVDRVHYQGIEYGSGIAGAREQWRQSGEERQGRVSSVFSFVGNMIWPWAYISLGMILAGWESLRQFPRILFLFVALASLLGFSTLNGGRTSLLLALAFIPCVGCARKRAGLSFLPRLFRNDKLLMAILSFAAVVYSSILMSLRARMNDSTPRDYLMSFVTDMLGTETEFFVFIDQIAEALGDWAYSFFFTLAQIPHPFWVFEEIINNPNRSGYILIAQPFYLLEKIGITSISVPTWAYSGLFVSLPGAIYYDYGLVGLLIGAVVHGVCLGWAAANLCHFSSGFLRLTLICAILIHSFLAPFIPAISVGPFMFLMFCLFVTSLTAVIWRRLIII